MKKKLISVAAIAAAAAIVGGALIACADKGEPVTEEQWKAAFAEDVLENVKMEMTSDMKQGDDTGTMNGVIVIADGSYSMEMSMVEGDKKEYLGAVVITEGETVKAYLYETDDETKKEWAEMSAQYAPNPMEYLSPIAGLDEMYGDFTFNEKTGCYDYRKDAEGDSGDYTSYSVKFKEAKIVEVVVETQNTDDEDGVMTVKTTLKVTYGGQTVTAPEVKAAA